MKIGIYAGSFDPLTKGHMEIVQKACKVFDKVILGIGINPAKKYLFTEKERIDLLTHVTFPLRPKVEIEPFGELLISLCDKHSQGNDVTIVRGLRALSDFDSEMAIAHTNADLDKRFETIFIPASPNFTFVSSSMVKELAKFKNADISKYVSPSIERALREKLCP